MSAFSFTTVTLNKNIELKTSVDEPNKAIYWGIEGEVCYVKIESLNNENRNIKAGTKFEITQVTDDKCGFDVANRFCTVSFEALNREEELDLAVTCKSKGLLVAPISEKKASKLSNGFMTIK